MMSGPGYSLMQLSVVTSAWVVEKSADHQDIFNYLKVVSDILLLGWQCILRSTHPQIYWYQCIITGWILWLLAWQERNSASHEVNVASALFTVLVLNEVYLPPTEVWLDNNETCQNMETWKLHVQHFYAPLQLLYERKCCVLAAN